MKLFQFYRFLQPPPQPQNGLLTYTDKRTNWSADIHLISTYAFLSEDEVKVFASQDQKYLIKEVYTYNFNNVTGSKKVELDSLVEYVTKQTDYEVLQRKIDTQKNLLDRNELQLQILENELQTRESELETCLERQESFTKNETAIKHNRRIDLKIGLCKDDIEMYTEDIKEIQSQIKSTQQQLKQLQTQLREI